MRNPEEFKKYLKTIKIIYKNCAKHLIPHNINMEKIKNETKYIVLWKQAFKLLFSFYSMDKLKNIFIKITQTHTHTHILCESSTV